MDVSILIVNFNGAAFLDQCLACIEQSQTDLRLETLILDNNSSDNSLVVLQPYRDRVTLIELDENIGFPNGVNYLLPHATGEYTLLLNSDAFIEPTLIDTLVSVMRSDSSIGVIAPQLLHEDGRLQVPGNPLAHWVYKTNKPRSVRFLSGAVMLLNTAYFRDTLHGLDPAFFFYNDDIDLCLRIRKDNKKVYYYPNVSATHIIGASSKTVKHFVLIEGYRGGFWIVKKHYGRLAYGAYRCLMGAVFWIKGRWHRCFSSPNHREHRLVCDAVVQFAIHGNIQFSKLTRS